jgi:ParB family chromosome partitioning protein
MLYDESPCASVSGDDVDYTCGESSFLTELSEEQSGDRGILSGLKHHCIAHRDRRRDLPREHEQREIPRDHLPRDAMSAIARELIAHQLRGACVVIKVTRYERYINVATLTDRFTVIE